MQQIITSRGASFEKVTGGVPLHDGLLDNISGGTVLDHPYETRPLDIFASIFTGGIYGFVRLRQIEAFNRGYKHVHYPDPYPTSDPVAHKAYEEGKEFYFSHFGRPPEF